jgi:hypothetical protein
LSFVILPLGMTYEMTAPAPELGPLPSYGAPVNDDKDAYDLWWAWAVRPLGCTPPIDAAIHDAVTALPPGERCDRAKVNQAVRDGLKHTPGRALN